MLYDVGQILHPIDESLLITSLTIIKDYVSLAFHMCK